METEKNIEIRLAEKEEFDQVRDFYHRLIDAMEGAVYHPRWEKDIYPTNDYLKDAIEKRELFVGRAEGHMAAAMVVNHAFNESYAQVNWPTEAEPEAVMVIHILGVHPDFGGRGFAKAMVAEAIRTAKSQRQKVLRLDVLEGNLPAERLYRQIGFKYVDTVRMYYEDTDWTNFQLYEYRIGDE